MRKKLLKPVDLIGKIFVAEGIAGIGGIGDDSGVILGNINGTNLKGLFRDFGQSLLKCEREIKTLIFKMAAWLCVSRINPS